MDTTADAHDNTTADGFCQTAAGACSLRAAVEQANQLAGPDVIRVPVGDFAYTTGRGRADDQLGHHAHRGRCPRDRRRRARRRSRCSSSIATGKLTVSDLALTKGALRPVRRRRARVDAERRRDPRQHRDTPRQRRSEPGLTVLGGTVTMRDSVDQRQRCHRWRAAGPSPGRRRSTRTPTATVTLRRTTVADNRATSFGVGSSAYGGGILSFGTVDLHHVTLAGNHGHGGHARHQRRQPLHRRAARRARGHDHHRRRGLRSAPTAAAPLPVTLGRNLDSGTSCGFGAGPAQRHRPAARRRSATTAGRRTR